jgi:hypothetical protein
MARTNQTATGEETCERCHTVLSAGQETCAACGNPTRYMSFKSRAAYEVEQWRKFKSAQPAS